jgi:hypothetical protein
MTFESIKESLAVLLSRVGTVSFRGGDLFDHQLKLMTKSRQILSAAILDPRWHFLPNSQQPDIRH